MSSRSSQKAFVAKDPCLRNDEERLMKTGVSGVKKVGLIGIYYTSALRTGVIMKSISTYSSAS